MPFNDVIDMVGQTMAWHVKHLKDIPGPGRKLQSGCTYHARRGETGRQHGACLASLAMPCPLARNHTLPSLASLMVHHIIHMLEPGIAYRIRDEEKEATSHCCRLSYSRQCVSCFWADYHAACGIRFDSRLFEKGSPGWTPKDPNSQDTEQAEMA